MWFPLTDFKFDPPMKRVAELNLNFLIIFTIRRIVFLIDYDYWEIEIKVINANAYCVFLGSVKINECVWNVRFIDRMFDWENFAVFFFNIFILMNILFAAVRGTSIVLFWALTPHRGAFWKVEGRITRRNFKEKSGDLKGPRSWILKKDCNKTVQFS